MDKRILLIPLTLVLHVSLYAAQKSQVKTIAFELPEVSPIGGDIKVASALTPAQFSFQQGIAAQNKRKSRLALACMEEAAALGLASATCWLGTYYYWHVDDEIRDVKKGLYYWKRATEQGDVDAPYYIGCLYQKGNPPIGKQDAKCALAYFMLASDRGRLDAVGKIMMMANNGDAGAFEYLEKYAKGEPVSTKVLCYLGDHYFQRAKSPMDLDAEQAFMYFNLAADLYCPDAEYYRALCYLQGVGVKQDVAKGRTLLAQLRDVGYNGRVELWCFGSEVKQSNAADKKQ
jgi:TPR repeat protein